MKILTEKQQRTCRILQFVLQNLILCSLFAVIFYLSTILFFYTPDTLSAVLKCTYLGICLIYLCFIMYYRKRLNARSFFISSIIFLSAIYLFLYLPFHTPDARIHFSAAYRYSNLILEPSASEWSGRREDALFYQNFPCKNPGYVDYYNFFKNISFFSKDNELVEMPKANHMKFYSFLGYAPLSIGLTLGRILHLSSSLTAYLAKFLLLLCYILTIAHAIKKTPIGKNIIAMTALLPISLMMSSAFSYDSMVILSTLAFIASIFKLKFAKEKYSLYECAFWAFIVASVKGGGYSLLFLLTLCLLDKKDKSSIKNMIFVLGAGLCSLILFDFLLVYGQHLFQFGMENNGKMMASDAFYKPVLYLKMLWTTYKEAGFIYLMSLMGQGMALFEFTIPSFVFICFWGIIIIAALFEQDKISLENRDNIILGTIIILTLCTLPIMLLSSTAINSPVISGIQGRYYLPVFPLFILLIINVIRKFVKEDFILKYQESVQRKSYVLFSFLSVISVLFMLNLYLMRW